MVPIATVNPKPKSVHIEHTIPPAGSQQWSSLPPGGRAFIVPLTNCHLCYHLNLCGSNNQRPGSWRSDVLSTVSNVMPGCGNVCCFSRGGNVSGHVALAHGVYNMTRVLPW
jgi:hypothetical protein